MNELPKNRDPRCAEIVKMAERELAAYLNAVTALFGAKQAQLAAKDWLRELETTNVLPVVPRNGEWSRSTLRDDLQLDYTCQTKEVLTACNKPSFRTLPHLNIPQARFRTICIRQRFPARLGSVQALSSAMLATVDCCCLGAHGRLQS